MKNPTVAEHKQYGLKSRKTKLLSSTLSKNFPLKQPKKNGNRKHNTVKSYIWLQAIHKDHLSYFPSFFCAKISTFSTNFFSLKQNLAYIQRTTNKKRK